MSRITNTTVYQFDELTAEAKTKAIDRWTADDDMPFLSEYMAETLAELLTKYKIKSDDAEALYSLSYSQGDGAMFTGHLEWRAWTLEVRHSGFYYHERSSQVWNSESTKTGKAMTDRAATEWNNLYIDICIELKKAGYAYIEAETDPENVAETLRANEYEFYANGEFYHER